MPPELEQGRENDFSVQNYCETHIFQSRDDMKHSLSRLCYGNFYVLGSLWIEALKSVLTGSKMCLIPTVSAQDQAPPSKPPKMRYKDLSMYDDPHNKYAVYEYEHRLKCPDANKKILHSKLLPTVSSYRKIYQKEFCEVQVFFSEMFSEFFADINGTKNRFKAYMRHPDNMCLRTAVVALLTVGGFALGKKYKWPPYKRNTLAFAGALYGGWLCFPKETDNFVRNTSHMFLLQLINMYNIWYDCNFRLRDPVCMKMRPDEPPPLNIDPKHQCKPKQP